MKSEPKISVVIPAYNSEQTISRAIRSVLNQSVSAHEIIVVNDGSCDNTAEKVKSFGDKVIYIEQKNAGVSVARNTGIKASTGDWIAFLDADDEWLLDKLKLQIDHIHRHPELYWTFGNFSVYFGNQKKNKSAHENRTVSAAIIENELTDDVFKAFEAGLFPWTGTVVIHRSVFEKTGMFEPGMKRAQDNDLWYRIGYSYPKAGYLFSPLSIYHRDTPESSTKVNSDIKFLIEMIDRHEKLSREAGRYEAFRPVISNMIKFWIRKLNRQKQYGELKILLERFNSYLPSRFIREMKLILLCPSVFSPLSKLINSTKISR